MTRLIPVGGGLGVQIPPHFIEAAQLNEASDVFFEMTTQGLLLSFEKEQLLAQHAFKPYTSDTPIADEFSRLRKGVTLGPETTLKQLIEDGHKW